MTAHSQKDQRPRGDGKRDPAPVPRDYAKSTAALEFAANHGLIQNALEAMDRGVAIFDSDNRLVVWNRQFIAVLDHPDSLARAGTHLRDFIRAHAERGEYGDGDIDELIAERFERVSNERSWTFERTQTNGAVIEVSHKRLPDGGLLSTFVDITEKKATEAKLRHHAAVLEQLTKAVLVTSLEPRVLDCNPAAEKVFGFSRAEMLGRSPKMLMADRSGWRQHVDAIAERLELDQTWTGRFDMRRKDGSLFFVEQTVAPLLDGDGNLAGTIAIHRDVTERRRTEALMRQQAVVLEQLGEAVTVIDLDRRIKDCNLAAARLFGYEPSELLGKSPDVFIADVAAWRAMRHEFISSLARHGSWNGEIEMRRKDGSLFMSELTVAPLSDEIGNIIANVTIFRDVTERHRAEAAIKESEEKYRSLFDSVQDGLIVNRLDGTIEAINQGFVNILGYTLDDMRDHDAITMTPKKWRHINNKVIRQVMNRGYSDEFEKEYIRKDGSVFPASIKGWLVRDRDGKPSRRMAMIRDITDVKREQEAQARLMTIIEGTSDLVAMMHKDGKLLYLNGAGRTMVGIGADEGLSDIHLMDFHTEESRHLLINEALPTVERNSIWQGETVFLGRDNREIQASQLILAHHGSNGQLEFYSTIARDISERMQTVMEMRLAKERAEIANRAKTEFLANMSHELRTPLNAIIGFSQMMRDHLFGELGTPQYEDYAASIHDSGKHLLGVINDILDLSKIEAGKYEIEEDVVQIEPLVEWCLNAVKPRAQSAKQRLVASVPDHDICLLGDEKALRQVILNLLSNSVKFTPADGVIEIAVTVGEDGLSLAVRDSGIGIPADKLDHVFQPFGQVDGTLSRQHDGTGLGLSITKSLVELHDAVIELESEEGKGTTVTLKFPPERLISEPQSEPIGATRSPG